MGRVASTCRRGVYICVCAVFVIVDFDFVLPVPQHNIRIVAKYYGRIELKRLSTLLDLNDDDTEKHVCVSYFYFFC